ncbi:MAG TPA: endolytic transglycosylase MltG, partial [Candidatus Saccharibacteria bacterium]|nr:endolytic transglycosylase MltG [Candidatus Saccharibacteria bacterium]
EKENLKELYAAQGLNLYEGITLASIIQREAIGGDETQIAQVFFKRLSIDMPLGSDVTYQYIADKMGVPRDVNLDSLYNTRRFQGLTPGPIAAPGLAALKAVAHPADTDYLYFLSGDDDVTYFGRTLEDHERNIAEHCQLKCQII